MERNANTRTAVLLGAPVSHSLSPIMHNAAFQALGMDAVFVANHVEAGELSDAVAQLRACPHVLGASVTVPHKRRVIESCDRLVSPADRAGAVNCLAFERAGSTVRVLGHNTDATGFVDSLVYDAGRDPGGQRVILLGAGGAARAVHEGLRASGAEQCTVIARAPGDVDWIDARPWTTAEFERLLPACDILVDCTSAGLESDSYNRIPSPIPLSALPGHALVASLVYHREPALLLDARSHGLATLSGAGMLIRQGARAFELWTGVRAPVEVMWAAAFGHS